MEGLIERINKKLTVPLARRMKDVQVITPNRLTFLSFLAGGVLAPIFVLKGWLFLAGVLVWVGAILDSLDGDLARLRGITSKEGAILDAVLDRYADLFILGALSLYSPECLSWGVLAMVGSALVPYIRAKTEAHGKPSVPTFGSRDVRNVVVCVGLLLHKPCLTLVVVAILSNLSALHRLFYALRREG